MTYNSLVYNNSLITVEDFIDSILYTKMLENQVSLCKFEETSNSYYITFKFFYKNKHTFNVYYKNNFLILQIKFRNCNQKALLTRMFYLTNIKLNKLSHIYYKDEVKLKIPKIYVD